jgi:hypothetical protein
VSVFGKLTCPTGASAAGQQVAVYQHQGPAGASSFSTIGTATTEADGSYKLTPAALYTNTAFRVREGNHRARTAVKVAPLVTLSGPAPGAQASALSRSSRSDRPTRATFTGTVSPADTGALVALQVAYAAAGEQWRTVAFGHVGSDGSYSIAHNFRAPGEVSIRTVAHTGRLNVPGASEPLSYQAPQPQNPRLTIQTSADPISYGQPVTISGVAAGAANQPVTLLAHTQGGASEVVATGTTDERGNYTFTQGPLQNTSYRVTDAKTTSTVLFERVKYALATAAAPNTAQAGQPLTFSGTVAPARAGQVVYLERAGAAGIGFRVVAVGTVNSDSTYSIVGDFSNIGSYLMRITVPSDGENLGSTSGPFTIALTG